MSPELTAAVFATAFIVALFQIGSLFGVEYAIATLVAFFLICHGVKIWKHEKKWSEFERNKKVPPTEASGEE